MIKTRITKILFPLATFLTLMSTPALAKNIKSVSLVIDTDIATGMEIGTEEYQVKTNTSGVSVYSVELTDIGNPNKPSSSSSSDDDDDAATYTGEWNANYYPTLKIVLETKDSDDRFKMTNSSDLKLTGTGDPVYKSVSSSGSKATVTVNLRSLRTGAGALNNAHFEEDTSNGYILYFDETTDDMYYEVKLYRNGKIQGTYLTVRGEDSLDLSEIILQPGTYTATVRVRNTATSTYSKWIKIDGQIQATKEEIDTFNNRTAVANPSEDESTKSTTTTGRWMQNSRGWWWQETNNSYPSSAWKEINNKWYYFDAEGYIVTGWQTIDSKKYLFDSTNGDMKKGWQYVDNSWYYFDQATGTMFTGWHVIKDVYYCFEETTGKLYTSTYTPDGFEVDASGAYTGKHKANIYDKYTFTTSQIKLYEVENVNYNTTTFTMDVKLPSQPNPGAIIASKGSDGEYTFYKVVASYPAKDLKSYSVYAMQLSESDIAQFAIKK